MEYTGFCVQRFGQGEREDGRFESFLVFSRETLDVTDENGCCACVVGASTEAGV